MRPPTPLHGFMCLFLSACVMILASIVISLTSDVLPGVKTEFQ